MLQVLPPLGECPGTAEPVVQRRQTSGEFRDWLYFILKTIEGCNEGDTIWHFQSVPSDLPLTHFTLIIRSSHRSRVKALDWNVTSFWWEPRPPTARPSPEMVVVCFGYNGSIFTDRLHSQHSISQYGPRSEGDIHTSKNSNVDIISIRLGFCSYRKPFHRKFAFNCWCTFIGRAFPTESSGQTKYYQ